MTIRQLNVCILMLVSILSFPGCDKSPDQKAYEEVVATMSMEKAKRFFDNYPRSQSRDRLIEDIREWCRREETKECYQLIIQTLPRDHRLYPEVVAFYEKRFGAKKLR